MPPSSLIEVRDDLGGAAAPCLANSPFEVADVILAVRDRDGSVSAAARDLSLSIDQVNACLDCHREQPDAVNARLIACDFSRPDDAETELFAEIDESPSRSRWSWRLATR